MSISKAHKFSNSTTQNKLVASIRRAKLRRYLQKGGLSVTSSFYGPSIGRFVVKSPVKYIDVQNVVLFRVDETLDNIALDNGLNSKAATAKNMFSNYRKNH